MRLVRVATFALSALLPLAAIAAVPNIRGIKAVLEDDRIVVTWQRPAGVNVAYYRVFYNDESILESGGRIDEFEIADSAKTEYILTSIPPVDALFLSVMATDAQGNESALFVEEARVDLRPDASSEAPSTSSSTRSSSPASSSPAPSIPSENGNTLKVLKAEAISATGVVLTFSHTVVIDRERAAEAFTIRSGADTPLPIRRIVAEGMTATLHTLPQERGRVYEVRVGNAVRGTNDQGQQIQLDALQGPILFAASAQAIAPSGPAQPMQPTQPLAPGMVPDVLNLRLSAQRGQGNAYIIEASWQPPAGIDLVSYHVSQTLDSGRTFGAPNAVPATVNGVRIANAPAGRFGLLVQAVTPEGNRSRGLLQFIDLPGAQPPMQPPAGSVLPQQPLPIAPRKGGLPTTGVSLAVIVAGAGGLLGWKRMRTRRQARGEDAR